MPTPLLTRDDLLFALTLGAELEHSLSCQYLYAAYALKSREDEGLTPTQLAMVGEWKTTLLEIARQEMEHMGLVNNLLTAIGAAPHLQRPNFPQPTGTYGIDAAAQLEGLSLDALDRFIEYEKPAADAVPVDLDIQGIHDLYLKVKTAFETLPEDVLFIGPPEAQVDNEALFLETVGRTYDVWLFKVTDRATALEAVEQIIEEGEGGDADDPQSHYWRLRAMREQYAAQPEGFAPSRAVVANPTTRQRHRGASGGVYLTHPVARAVADLFGTAYEAMLFALYRFYARTDETEAELFGLQHTAFFPMMVMVLRPLAEMLSELPAFEDASAPRAGAPFEFYRSIQLLPYKASAWVVIGERLHEMEAAAREICAMEGCPARMPFLLENLTRIAANFDTYMDLGPPEDA